MANIASLHVYPVKSCRGIDLDTARVTATGLEWDRRWMVVDARDRFVTQRTRPGLAKITTAIAAGRLRLSVDGRPPLDVDAEAGGPVRSVQIWKDSCSGIDAGDAAAAWLSDALGDHLRLVRMDEHRDIFECSAGGLASRSTVTTTSRGSFTRFPSSPVSIGA